MPEADKSDAGNVAGSSLAAMTAQVLKQCGDELTRENVMKQAASLHDFTVPMLLPGIKANTSPTDFAPLKQVQMARFDGRALAAVRPVADRRDRLTGGGRGRTVAARRARAAKRFDSPALPAPRPANGQQTQRVARAG